MISKLTMSHGQAGIFNCRKTCADPEIPSGGTDNSFSHQHISQKGVQTSLKKQLDPLDRGSLAEILRKFIATCGFQWSLNPQSTSESAHGRHQEDMMLWAYKCIHSGQT